MEVRKDLLGNIPEVGDLITFNPPSYSGLTIGKCIGFSSAGLPNLSELSDKSGVSYRYEKNGFYTPRTGFIIVKKR